MLVGVMVDSVHHAVEVFLEGLDIVNLNRHGAAKSSVLTAKKVKQVARARRTRLQGGEDATGTPKGCADSGAYREFLQSNR
jgi:hypothetical protein